MPVVDSNVFPKIIVGGLTGAVSQTRLVGANATGAPASGTFSTGDIASDLTGKWYMCTSGGSPGTWVPMGATGLTELAFAQITSPVTVTATTEATAAVLVTLPSVTFTGAPVEIEFYSPGIMSTLTALFITLHDDTASASLGWIGTTNSCKRRITPSAGARVYSIRAFEDSGTGTIEAGAGGSAAYCPAYARIVG